MTDNEFKDVLATIAAENAAGFAALREAQAQTDSKYANVLEMLNGISKSQGMVAEEFYANSLTLNPTIGKLKFDQVMTDIKVGKRVLNSIICFSS